MLIICTVFGWTTADQNGSRAKSLGDNPPQMVSFERINSNFKNNWDLAIFGPPDGALVRGFRKRPQPEITTFFAVMRRKNWFSSRYVSNLLVFCSKHPSTVPGEGDETLPALIWTCWPRKSSPGPRKVTFFLQNRLAAPEPRFSFPTFDAEHKNHIILDWFKVVTTHGSPISE